MSANSSTPIEIDKYCINKFLDRIASNRNDTEAQKLKQTAIDIVENCINVYSNTFGSGDVGVPGTGIVSSPYKDDIPNGTTGLIYGKVQSGKTETTIATLALAQANKFGCFIVLTSDNTWLGKQTANRFKIQVEGGPVVYDWDQWRSSPKEFGNKLRDYMKDTGVVLVSTKNVHHLEGLLDVLQTVVSQKESEMVGKDCFIVTARLPMSTPPVFKWRPNQAEIIRLNVRWYCRYALSYRDLEEMMQERGVPGGSLNN